MRVGVRPQDDREVNVRILGSLEVSTNGRRIDFGGARRRALFAILVLERNRVVSNDRLVDAIWGERPPATATKAVQNLVVQVRKALNSTVGVALETEPPGYVLRIADEAVDAHRFELLVSEGTRLVESDPASANDQLGAALDLWTGDALADFAYESFAQREIARLEELRLTAVEERIDARLALGHAAELVPELDVLTEWHPERERLHGQLMLALYRSGRQSEALDVYRELRERLHDQLGLEPGPPLRHLQQAILAQDPELGPPPRLPVSAQVSRPRTVAFGIVVLVLAAAALALGVALASRGSGAPTVVPNSVVKIDAESNEITDVIRVGRDPGELAIVGPYVFVAGQQDGTLTRIDRGTGELTTSGQFDATGSIAGAGGSIWVVSTTRNSVSRVSTAGLDFQDGIRLSGEAHHLLTLIDVGGGSLWTSEWFPPVVSRWNLRTLDRIWRYQLSEAEYPLEVTFGLGAAWAALWTTNHLLRIDAVSGRRTEISVGRGPRDPAVGLGSVWTAMAQDGTVWRIDPRSGTPRAVIDVGKVPWGVAVGERAVWVSNNCEGSVSRIDPETNQVVATIHTGFFPQWLAADDEQVWVGLSDTGSGVPAAGPAALALPQCT